MSHAHKPIWHNRLRLAAGLALVLSACMAASQISLSIRQLHGPIRLFGLWGAAPRTQQPLPPDAPCSQRLGVDKVALMFLTKGPIVHERTWTAWLQSAAGLVPQQARDAVCSSSPVQWQETTHACLPSQLSPHQRLPGHAQQHLFTLYVHALPNFTGFDPGSAFAGKLLADRVETEWGSISLVNAERLLLEAALKDPANKKFLLISDTDIPIYDPLTFYQQLMHEDRSRVKACKTGPISEYRWNRFMGIYGVHLRLWRKSSQWFGLTREHAQLVVHEKTVYNAFRRFCIPHNNRTKVECYPDEHYFATLLASLEREEETYCDGNGVSSANWSAGGAHPREYGVEDVTPSLYRQLRPLIVDNKKPASECNRIHVMSDARQMFVPFHLYNQQHTCKLLTPSFWNPRLYSQPLPGGCPLTARKFPMATEEAVLSLSQSTCFGTRTRGWGCPFGDVAIRRPAQHAAAPQPSSEPATAVARRRRGLLHGCDG